MHDMSIINQEAPNACFVSSIEYRMSVTVQESQRLSISVPAIDRVGKSPTQKFKLHHLLTQLHSVRENEAEGCAQRRHICRPSWWGSLAYAPVTLLETSRRAFLDTTS